MKKFALLILSFVSAVAFAAKETATFDTAAADHFAKLALPCVHSLYSEVGELGVESCAVRRSRLMNYAHDAFTIHSASCCKRP
jgi:hypothetical protein